jgi:hypothetical protein
MDELGDSVIRSVQGLAMLEKMRGICTSYPGVAEHVDGFGHSSFRVKDKPFVILGEREGFGPGISIKTSKETQEFLMLKGGYFKTPYIGQHGWITTRAEKPDWKGIEELVEEAYVRTAPKRLLRSGAQKS